MRIKGEAYRADIDGLRALAILPVIFYHAKLGCPGGFVGVDVFFVISGYLITSLILKELQTGTFSLVQFWERRVRRILPALAVVVLACLVAAWFCFLPADFAVAGKSAIAQVFLISNIFFWSQAGYFDATSETKPLLHTWSLAVEEQFYLFFPLFLLGWSRFRRQPVSFVKVTMRIALISFGASVYATYAYGSFSFYWLPTRAWELMIGALLAMTRERFPASRKISESLGWLGLFLLVLVTVLYDDNTRFPGLAAVAPCLGTALVIYSSELELSRVGRMLSFKPLVFVGLISYSLYLWHWPLLVFCRYWSFEEPGCGFRAGLLGISGVLAFLSWKYVETPIRRRLVFKSRAQIFSFAAGAGVLVLAAGAAIDQGRGFPSHKPSYNNLRFVDGHTNAFFNADASVDDALAGKFLGLGVDALETATNRPVNLLLWGDSHAQALGPVVDDLSRRHSWKTVQAAHPGTPPVLGYISLDKASLHGKSPEFNAAVLNYIARNHVSNVLLAGFWSLYLRQDRAHAVFFKAQLLKTVRAVLDTGARVYVVKDVPDPGFNVPRYISLATARGRSLDSLGETAEHYELANGDLEDAFDQMSRMGATVLDPKDYFLIRKGFYGVVKDGAVLYWDNTHMTCDGAEMLAPLFETIFRKN